MHPDIVKPPASDSWGFLFFLPNLAKNVRKAIAPQRKKYSVDAP
jgi:hypothetical protein